MAISLDWEEGIFIGIRQFVRKLKRLKKEPYRSESEAPLQPLLPRLHFLARIVGGKPLNIRAAEASGGLHPDTLLLPAYINIAPDMESNIQVYLLRTMIAAQVLADLDISRHSHPMVQKAFILLAHRRATDVLIQKFEKFGTHFQEVLRYERARRPKVQDLPKSLQGFETFQLKLLSENYCLNNQEAMQFEGLPIPKETLPCLHIWADSFHFPVNIKVDDAADHHSLHENAGGTEEKAFSRDHVKRTQLEKEDQIEPLPVHTFEKTETLDAYKGGARKVDGSDELGEHLEALQEVDLREVIRGGASAQSVFKADLDIEMTQGSIHSILPNEAAIAYPEWDGQKKRLKPDFALVYPTPGPKGHSHEFAAIRAKHRNLVNKMFQRLHVHRNKDLLLSRQTFGDCLDLDSVVDGLAAIKAGCDPGEKFYSSRRKAQRDIATTVLFDMSLSSGSWVANRRLIDVIREAVLVFGEVAFRLGDAFQIQCFASHTRHHCRVWDLKTWDQPWPSSGNRLFGLEPQGYTRMGPAIRHALALLAKAPQRHKLLLILTDGKPTDYDRYEGRYGIEDVRMALKAGRAQGMATYALAFDPSSSRHLPFMFGPGQWQILKQLSQLPSAITTAYGNLTG